MKLEKYFLQEVRMIEIGKVFESTNSIIRINLNYVNAFEQNKEIYKNSKEEINIVDTLDKRERWVVNYIINNRKIKAKDIANHFKINLDTANNWIKKWIEKEFLIRFDNRQIRNVDYILTDKYSENVK